MNHIGTIIRQYRLIKGLTQKELAVGICSVHYIFLIEKGERTPSLSTLKEIGDKLKVDLFSVYQYLECEDPIHIYETISEFDRCRRKFDLDGLKSATGKKSGDPCFPKKPLLHEIQFNRAAQAIWRDHDVQGAIIDFENSQAKGNDLQCRKETQARYLALIASGYLMLGDLKRADSISKEALSLINVEIANDILIDMKVANGFVAAKLVQMAVQYGKGEVETVLKEGLILSEFQMLHGLYDRIEFTNFYLSLAYHKGYQEKKALEHARKVVYVALLNEVPNSVDWFSKNKDFLNILLSAQSEFKCIQEFFDRYPLATEGMEQLYH